MAVGFGLAVVVAHDGGDDMAVTPLEAGDIAVEGEILAVLVMTAVTDAVAEVVKKSACFQLNARLNRQVVDRLQLIEEHQAEFADMLRVALIVFQAAAEAARGNEHLTCIGAVAVRFLPGECVPRNFLQQAFSKADARNCEQTNIEVAAQGKKDEGGNRHDIGTISANAVSLHALADVKLQKVGEAFT